MRIHPARQYRRGGILIGQGTRPFFRRTGLFAARPSFRPRLFLFYPIFSLPRRPYGRVAGGDALLSEEGGCALSLLARIFLFRLFERNVCGIKRAVALPRSQRFSRRARVLDLSGRHRKDQRRQSRFRALCPSLFCLRLSARESLFLRRDVRLSQAPFLRAVRGHEYLFVRPRALRFRGSRQGKIVPFRFSRRRRAVFRHLFSALCHSQRPVCGRGGDPALVRRGGERRLSRHCGIRVLYLSAFRLLRPLSFSARKKSECRKGDTSSCGVRSFLFRFSEYRGVRLSRARRRRHLFTFRLRWL